MGRGEGTKGWLDYRAAAILAVVLGSVSCALLKPGDAPTSPLVRKGPTPNQLRSAPDRISVASQTYALEAYLWRDLMPGPQGKLKPLHAVIRASPQQLPVGAQARPLRIDRVWLIQGEAIWEAGAGLAGEGPIRTIDDGPLWDVGGRVDVVALVLNTAWGGVYLLSAPNEVIRRTG